MRNLVQVVILLAALAFPVGVLAILLHGTLGGGSGDSMAPAASASPITFAAPTHTARPLDGYVGTPTPTLQRYSPLDATPPPTVVAPQRTPIPAVRLGAGATPATGATPGAGTTGGPAIAHGVVYNTGGIGAVLRDAPVDGARVASLREGLTLDVLDRTSAGGRDWFHVRTPDGLEGWVSSLVLKLDAPLSAADAAATPGAGAGLQAQSDAPSAALDPPAAPAAASPPPPPPARQAAPGHGRGKGKPRARHGRRGD